MVAKQRELVIAVTSVLTIRVLAYKLVFHGLAGKLGGHMIHCTHFCRLGPRKKRYEISIIVTNNERISV